VIIVEPEEAVIDVSEAPEPAMADVEEAATWPLPLDLEIDAAEVS
jgi:hypothetical protein